jgi:DNA-binding response OmpR family regulator
MSRPATILIVEDEPNVRLVLRTALDSHAYTLITAEDGPTALGRVKQALPDLILLDLRMPGMGGLEVLRTMREQGVQVPVIILTAYGSVPDAMAALKLGAVDFLAKPLTPEVLRRTVAEVLLRHDRNPAMPPRVVVDPATRALQEAKRELNVREFDKAEALLETALKLDPRLAEAHFLRGVLHELRGERHTAYADYRAALEVDAHFEPARRHLTNFFTDSPM